MYIFITVIIICKNPMEELYKQRNWIKKKIDKKTSDFLSLNFHVDFDLENPVCLVLPFSHVSLVKHLS